MNPEVSAKEVVTYYDQCEVDYRWLWHLDDNAAMHYGYWNEDTRHLREALKNMNQYVIDKLDIQQGQRILDAGCGVGGTSIYVSSKYDVAVHGITLSQNQVEKAIDKSSRALLIGKTHFSVQDYCNTSFKNSSFDGIYGMESICHANEKADFLKEAYRLLKPEGTLVVGDFFKTPTVDNPKNAELISKWADTWAIPDFADTMDFIQKAEKAGLTLIENNLITEKIKKSAKRLHMMFYPGIVMQTLLKPLGFRNSVQGKNVWSTYYQYKSLLKGLWEYRVLKFSKATKS